MRDEQDQAEALDDEKLDDGPPPDGPVGEDAPAEDYPPDRPLGVTDPQAAGVPDDLSRRSAREEPEPTP